MGVFSACDECSKCSDGRGEESACCVFMRCDIAGAPNATMFHMNRKFDADERSRLGRRRAPGIGLELTAVSQSHFLRTPRTPWT